MKKKKIYQKPLTELILVEGERVMRPTSWYTGQKNEDGTNERYNIIEGTPDDDVDDIYAKNSVSVWDAWDE